MFVVFWFVCFNWSSLVALIQRGRMKEKRSRARTHVPPPTAHARARARTHTHTHTQRQTHKRRQARIHVARMTVTMFIHADLATCILRSYLFDLYFESYLCRYARTRAHTHTHTHTHRCIVAHACMRICTHTHALHTGTHTHTHTRACATLHVNNMSFLEELVALLLNVNVNMVLNVHRNHICCFFIV